MASHTETAEREDDATTTTTTNGGFRPHHLALGLGLFTLLLAAGISFLVEHLAAESSMRQIGLQLAERAAVAVAPASAWSARASGANAIRTSARWSAISPAAAR